MQVGIIGAGKIGATVARLLTRAGEKVAIANSRGPDSLQPLVEELGASARATNVEGAARFGDIVLVAIPLHAYTDLPPEPFARKIVIDANNYYPGRDGHIEQLDRGTSTSTELLAAHLPGAHVVKAFNTMYYGTLATEGKPEAPRADRLALYVAADDEHAKQRVSELIERLGFAAVDTGSLAEGGRRQQPDSPIYNNPITLDEAERRLAAITRA
jgi:predicted dinucleotide-binding enzyme